VSVEAISWALNLAPVPADRGGQPSSACKFVLVGLANHAGPDGTGAFPSVATLVRYTGLSERTVRTCLDRLQGEGIISPCDPDIVAARIKRADRRPQGWDLDLSLVRTDIDDPRVAVPDSRSPTSRAGQCDIGRRHDEGHANRVQPLHPGARPVDNVAHEVQQLHPAAGTGCSPCIDGVQPAQSRGAAVAPEPSREPSSEPSAAHASAHDVPPIVRAAYGGRPTDEYFAALGDGWRLSAAQCARLATFAERALSAGWTPAALAAFTGANTSGVRNPYAVLAARLSPAELPEPPVRWPPRPPWCGTCDEPTRRRQDAHGADAGRCPSCHPLAVGTARHGRAPTAVSARPPGTPGDSRSARARRPRTARDASSGHARWSA
jgi:Helix-turn-helix domain